MKIRTNLKAFWLVTFETNLKSKLELRKYEKQYQNDSLYRFIL